MDDVTIAGGMNQTVSEASGSVHFREHFSEIGDLLVLEYHFTVLPEKIDLSRISAAFNTVNAISWTNHHNHSAVTFDGAIGGNTVSVVIRLEKEKE